MKYSWWELIKYVIAFFFGREKQEEDKRREEQKRTAEELKNKYDKLDKQKQEENKDEIEDRLHNIFK